MFWTCLDFPRLFSVFSRLVLDQPEFWTFLDYLLTMSCNDCHNCYLFVSGSVCQFGFVCIEVEVLFHRASAIGHASGPQLVNDAQYDVVFD